MTIRAGTAALNIDYEGFDDGLINIVIKKWLRLKINIPCSRLESKIIPHL